MPPGREFSKSEVSPFTANELSVLLQTSEIIFDSELEILGGKNFRHRGLEYGLNTFRDISNYEQYPCNRSYIPMKWDDIGISDERMQLNDSEDENILEDSFVSISLQKPKSRGWDRIFATDILTESIELKVGRKVSNYPVPVKFTQYGFDTKLARVSPEKLWELQESSPQKLIYSSQDLNTGQSQRVEYKASHTSQDFGPLPYTVTVKSLYHSLAHTYNSYGFFSEGAIILKTDDLELDYYKAAFLGDVLAHNLAKRYLGSKLVEGELKYYKPPHVGVLPRLICIKAPNGNALFAAGLCYNFDCCRYIEDTGKFKKATAEVKDFSGKIHIIPEREVGGRSDTFTNQEYFWV